MEARAAVFFYSKTGNTKKIAIAISRAIKASLIDIGKIASAKRKLGIEQYDILFIGSPVYACGPAPIVKSFIQELPRLKEKKAAIFCTYALIGAKTSLKKMASLLRKKGAFIVGKYACKAESALFAGIGPKIWNKGRPNRKDLDRAAEFARNCISERF